MRIWLNDLNDVWRIILPSSIKNHGYVHRNTTAAATFSHKRFYGMLNTAGDDPADSMGLIISKIFGAGNGRNVNVWPFWTDAQYLLKFLLCGREEPVKRVTDGSWGSVGGAIPVRFKPITAVSGLLGRIPWLVITKLVAVPAIVAKAGAEYERVKNKKSTLKKRFLIIIVFARLKPCPTPTGNTILFNLILRSRVK